MKEFIRNNKFTLTGFLIGLIIAIGLYFSNKKSNRYRVVFQYNLSDSLEISSSLKQDTFFIFNSIPIRTYMNSITDTLVNQGIKRSELIIYSGKPSNQSKLNKQVVQPLTSSNASIVYFNFEGEKEYNKRFLLVPLIGLLLGYLVNLFNLRLIARKNASTTPI